MIEINHDQGKGTRIVITPELNNMLDAHIKELKSKGFKGIKKKNMVEELIKAGLEYQKQATQDGSVKGDIHDTGVVHPPTATPRAPILETKSELEILRDVLKKKESQLMERGKHLDSRETLINQKYEYILVEKENTYNERYKQIEEIGKNVYNEQRVKNLEEENSNLRSDNRTIQREFMAQLRIIEKNTDKDIFIDAILPLAAPAMVGFLIYIQMTESKPGAKVPPVIKQFIDILTGLPAAERTKMVNEVIEVIKKYAAKREKKQG
ncbi:MAG: hypothetical protein K8R74_02235 [Bacteroidales bacterium]|nr:hypothetical protein [Bacteroidales bacterium]